MINNVKRVFVTGANGFIGRAVCASLINKGFIVRGTVRNSSNPIAGMETVCIDDIGAEVHWDDYLNDIDVVIHLAARVHVMKETAGAPLTLFRKINVEGTERLAKKAAASGVKRFVFLSSVGVNGNVTLERPFSERDKPQPYNDYSLSKLEAERVLKEITLISRMEGVVIRAPLVYGPFTPGNFFRLLSLVSSGMVLPLASVRNSRSYIFLGNLVDSIIACMNHPKAAGQTYLVSDDENISTPELIRQIANALGKPARLFYCPPSLLRFAGRITGSSEIVNRLIGSLVVDISQIHNDLNWQPPFTLSEGLKETASWYKG